MFSLTRVPHNPILTPQLPWERAGVLNPGITRFNNQVLMLYRAIADPTDYVSHLGLATSDDGITFTRAGTEPIFGPSHDYDKFGTEDPRITQIDDTYYITYVGLPVSIHSTPLVTATALVKTTDFTHFDHLGIITPEGSDNKDTVLFPQKIHGKYHMLHRPNNNWSPLPAIWIAESTNLTDWSNHQLLFATSHPKDAKIGPGLPPIKTSRGWLLIYHHVTNNLVYSISAALLDLDDPHRLIGKLPHGILYPLMPYEANILFPTGGFVQDDQLYVYYGANDYSIGLATCSLTDLLAQFDPTP